MQPRSPKLNDSGIVFEFYKRINTPDNHEETSPFYFSNSSF